MPPEQARSIKSGREHARYIFGNPLTDERARFLVMRLGALPVRAYSRVLSPLRADTLPFCEKRYAFAAWSCPRLVLGAPSQGREERPHPRGWTFGPRSPFARHPAAADISGATFPRFDRELMRYLSPNLHSRKTITRARRRAA